MYTLEDVISQFENQTQQDKDWTFAEARHETQTDNMRASIQYNNEPETIIDCTVSSHTTNTKQNNIAVANKAENCASIKSPKNADNKPDAKQINTVIQIFKCNMAE